jgi:YbbR domain-containing protein
MFRLKYHIIIAAFFLSVILWISLNFNQIYEIDKTIPIKININKPYAVSGNIPLNLEVKIRGLGWNLFRISTAVNIDFNYTINARKKETIVILTKDYLEKNLSLSQNLQILYVYPETLFVKVEDYEEKYVKILPNLNLDIKEGYQLVGEPLIEPDSIKIGGAVDLLKSISTLNTKPVYYSNINSNIAGTVTVSDSLSNLLWFSQTEFKLKLNIEPTAEKEFDKILIQITNIPADKEVLLIPQFVAVQLKGGVNQLAAIDAAEILAKIDYNDIIADTTGSLIPKFQIPKSCVITSVKPESIQYVIKKKY